MAKKGLELPINMIIVIAIAVLVLVVVIAFFVGQTGSGINTIELEKAFNTGCVTLRTTYGCSNFAFNVNYQKPGSTSTTTPFSQVCVDKGYVATTSDAPTSCGRACGCSV